MIAIDTTKNQYRFTIRCDGCGREIKDASKANAAFAGETTGELRLRGVFCKEKCAHETQAHDDAWELHQVLALVSRNVNFQRDKAKRQVDGMLGKLIPLSLYNQNIGKHRRT